MPVFKLETNVKCDKIPKGFVKEASQLVANLLGKPESYVCVVVVAGQEHMMFGGTAEPCGFALLGSIGGIGPGNNKGHSAKLAKLVEDKIGIPQNRMYIQFVNWSGSEVGYNGGTF